MLRVLEISGTPRQLDHIDVEVVDHRNPVAVEALEHLSRRAVNRQVALLRLLEVRTEALACAKPAGTCCARFLAKGREFPLEIPQEGLPQLFVVFGFDRVVALDEPDLAQPLLDAPLLDPEDLPDAVIAAPDRKGRIVDLVPAGAPRQAEQIAQPAGLKLV